MSTNVREPLPLEVSHLGSFEARMLRGFGATVEDWDEVCSALGPWEAKHLATDETPKIKEQHRRWVTELLSWGRVLHRAIQQPGFPDKTLVDRVSARIQHLEDKLAIWHREMTPAEEERILREAFQ